MLGKNPTSDSVEIHPAEVAMLVLRRRKGEEIIVNDRIRIVVAEIGNGSCSLAFEAPLSDQIRRAELPPFQEAILQRTASALQLPQ
jgi:carbon storage regulator CsrA